MLQDLPARAWVGVALTWARTLALALVFVQVGRVVDALIRPGGDTTGPLVLAGCGAVVAAVCAGLAAAEPPRLRAMEEAAWRGRAIRAVLARDPEPGRAAGAEVSLLTDGVERVAGYRAEFLGPTLAAFTAPLLVLTVLALVVDPLTTLLLALLVALVPAVVAGFMRLFRASNARYRRLAGQAAARFHETLRALGSLVLLGAAGAGRATVDRAAEELRREAVGMLRRNQLMILVNDAVFSLVMVTAAAGLALSRYDTGAVSAGQVVSVLLLATLLYEPIDKVGRSFYVGMAGRAQQGALRGLLARGAPLAAAPASASATSAWATSDETAPSVSRRPTSPRVSSPNTRSRPPAVEVRGLDVTRGERTVLRGVETAVPAGGVLAVVGPSGAGKSTLAAVLQGLLPAAAGQVLLDGRPASATELRSRVVTVGQRPFLFTGTLAENLRLARPGAGEEELWEALRLARLDAEVEAMPAGLDTQVGEGGAHLSGGQARRLAIARAVLSDSPVLVLDEPTADLDRRTEDLVSASLRGLTGRRTLVLVAHRLRTTAWADRVLVLDGGRVAAFGPPAQVLSAEGYYARATREDAS